LEQVTNHPRNKFRKWHRLIAAVILVLLAAYFVYTQWIEVIPYYAVKYDPEMQYFLNSLAFFKGVSYAYIDHPGTPLEVIGSLLLAFTRPLTRGQDVFFIPYHLQNPQFVLTLLHSLLTLFSLLTVGLLMMKAWPIKGWGSLIASLGIGVTYFAVFSPLTFQTLDWWTHNGFNLPFGTLLMLGVLLRLRRSEPLQALEILFVSMLSGLLVTVQLYFIAWAIGILVALVLFSIFLERRWLTTVKVGFLSMVGLVLGFFMGFAPVMHRFRRFYIWVHDLVFHQGAYGHGPEGFTTLGRFMDNLLWLWERGQVVFLISLVAIVLVIVAMMRQRKHFRRVPGWWAMTIGGVLQFLLLWFMIGKHPGTNYLVSVAALLPILFLLSFMPFLKDDTKRAYVPLILGAVLIVLFLSGLVAAIKDQRSWAKQVRASEAAIDEIVQSHLEVTGKTREELTILWGYAVPSRCYALRFANASTEGGALGEEIDEICPNEWMFDVWGGYVELPKAYEPLVENDDWDVVILPEIYVPSGIESVAKVFHTEIQTRGFGRVTILIAE
jgi:hypothetical protein